MNEKRNFRRVYHFFRPLIKLIFPFSMEGRENIPEGPALLCANHSSMFDPLLITLSMDCHDFHRHLAKVECNKIPLIGWMMRKSGTIFVRRDGSDMDSVRAFLMEQQRSLARRYSVIMDGRDIGTVVLPDADIKIFLTASAEDRARRRYEENLAKGVQQSFEEVLADIIERDERDSSRAAAPLRAAEDAIYMDTSGNSFEESLELLCGVIRERVG